MMAKTSEDLADRPREDREDYREDDPMDNDVARLENAKDLLALGGKSEKWNKKGEVQNEWRNEIEMKKPMKKEDS